MENTFIADGTMPLPNFREIEIQFNRSGDSLRYRIIVADDRDAAEIQEAEIEPFYPHDDPDWPYADDKSRVGFIDSDGRIYYLDGFFCA